MHCIPVIWIWRTFTDKLIIFYINTVIATVINQVNSSFCRCLRLQEWLQVSSCQMPKASGSAEILSTAFRPPRPSYLLYWVSVPGPEGRLVRDHCPRYCPGRHDVAAGPTDQSSYFATTCNSVGSKCFPPQLELVSGQPSDDAMKLFKLQLFNKSPDASWTAEACR